MKRASCSSVLVALLAATFIPFSAKACEDPPPYPFDKAIRDASAVFVFRLESAEIKREYHGPTAFAEWVEGRIRVVHVFKGDASAFRGIEYNHSWCNGLRLDVGHYFVIATNATGETIQLRPRDQSIIDVSFYFSELTADRNLQYWPFEPITDFVNGKPLPDEFPPEFLMEYIRALPSPPPPPPPPCPCQ
jgi:hypothetical protein